MSQHNCSGNGHITHRFSVWEKILMGTSIYGSVAMGLYGIYLVSPLWSLVYFGFVNFGMLVLFGYGLCSHCPYIYEEYKDCLFPPWGRIYRMMFKYRPGKLSVLDKICFFTTLIGILVIPIYWLLNNPPILALFLGFYGATIAGFVLYECRHCRHVYCPFNASQQKQG